MAVALSNADIVSRLKLLADSHLKADSGTTTTAVTSTLINESDITNHYICFISGLNNGVDRIITSFIDQSGTIGFDALDNAIDSTTEFCLLSKGFQSDIAQAEDAIRNDFRNKGYDLDLFLNSSIQLKEMFIFKTISIICGSLINDANDEDIYYFQYNRFKSLYESEQSVIIADYDANEDGNIDSEEELLSVGQVGFNR